jgi:hypothetical protein
MEHLLRFQKDIKICLTRNAKGNHAYFPALITSIGFAEFLSGLYAGNLDGPGLKQLKKYAAEFMTVEYTTDRVNVLVFERRSVGRWRLRDRGIPSGLP